MRRVEPLVLSALVATGAAVVLTAGVAATGGIATSFAAEGWLWLASIALVSTVAAIVLFFAGLRRVGPSGAAILSTFEPVVTVALAAALFGDALTPLQLAGGACVLAAVIMLRLRARAAPAPVYS